MNAKVGREVVVVWIRIIDDLDRILI
jgi:hypothetical protein